MLGDGEIEPKASELSASGGAVELPVILDRYEVPGSVPRRGETSSGLTE